MNEHTRAELDKISGRRTTAAVRTYLRETPSTWVHDVTYLLSEHKKMKWTPNGHKADCSTVNPLPGIGTFLSILNGLKVKSALVRFEISWQRFRTNPACYSVQNSLSFYSGT